MIIDLHTHVWQYPEHLSQEFAHELSLAWGLEPEVNSVLNAPPERHWADYREGPASRVVVLAFRSRWLQLDIPNEYVAAYVAQHPEKLIGFAAVDPNDPDPAGELRHAICELGLKGLKLGPVYQNFHPMDARMLPVYAAAQELRIPILFHQGTTFPRRAPLMFAQPLQLEEVALSFPELKIIIAHMGHPWELDTIALIRKQPNVYADISSLGARPWQFYNSLRLAVEYRVMHKLLFGTDYPFFSVRQTIESCRQVCDFASQAHLLEIPKALIEEMIHRDSLQLLGIPDVT